MLQPQLSRVEHDRRRGVASVSARRIERVSDDRMADAREVRADLMRAAGLEHELEQCVIARMLDPREMCDSGLAALLHRHDRAPVVTRWIAAQR